MSPAAHVIVVCMRPDPEPEDAVGGIHSQRAVPDSDADGVKALDTLEVEGGMAWIGLE